MGSAEASAQGAPAAVDKSWEEHPPTAASANAATATGKTDRTGMNQPPRWKETVGPTNG